MAASSLNRFGEGPGKYVWHEASRVHVKYKKPMQHRGDIVVSQARMTKLKPKDRVMTIGGNQPISRKACVILHISDTHLTSI